ncbi:hypothetical protein [Mahella australiensis]|uniref:Uncharacterized protein n=1 Tax=Mahella australiensis (strain DSM 15567 / CIP 107919 / 50-1 BON) TaxID=697281 RepID=F3ZX02_MAHA5|nr:hypothetical protein [Mahella australiensis]AEE97624.1 hypothetical protein Mahau_2466 [Mahella australiensis 50-1 BON]
MFRKKAPKDIYFYYKLATRLNLLPVSINFKNKQVKAIDVMFGMITLDFMDLISLYTEALAKDKLDEMGYLKGA